MALIIPTNLNKPLITRVQGFAAVAPPPPPPTGPFLTTASVTTSGVENQPTLAAEMASLGPRGGTIWFPPGQFQVTNLSVTPNITLRGSHSTSGSVSTRITAVNGSSPVLSIKGVSGGHIQNVTIQDMNVYGGPGGVGQPVIDTAFTSYLRFYRCAIGNSLLPGIQLLENWDSRIVDCDFEYCGAPDGTSGCINCVNGPTDNTNSLCIKNCRFESFFSVAIKGVGNSNKIFMRDCKLESAFSLGNYIDFNGCTHLGMRNMQMTIDGNGTCPGYMKIVNCYGVFGNVSFENTSFSLGYPTGFATITNTPCVDLRFLIMDGVADSQVSSGHILNWDGLNASTSLFHCQSKLTTSAFP